MSASSPPISFRLDDENMRRLAGAAAGAETKPANFARQALLDRLDGVENSHDELEAVRSDLRKLTKEFSAFRMEFATAVEALLISSSSGKPVTAKLAKQFVDERIRARKPFTASD